MLGWLLRCSHARTTFPLTPLRKPGASARRGTYIVCLDCGKEFDYDWSRMKIMQWKGCPKMAAGKHDFEMR
jgi:hypothetical protein